MPLMQWQNQRNHSETHHTNYNINWPLFDNVTNSMSRINIIKTNQTPVHYMMKSATIKSNASKRHSAGHKSIAQQRRKRKRLNETNQSKDNRIVKNFLADVKTTVVPFVLNEDRPDLSSNRTLVSELNLDASTVKSDMDIQTKKYQSVITSTPESIKSTENAHLDLSSTSSTTKSVFHKTNSNGTTALTLPAMTDEGAFRIERTTAVTRKRSSGLDRNERSANLSHITGTARKIQLLIKNRLLQLMPDGSVNGTQDDGSDYSKFIFYK